MPDLVLPLTHPAARLPHTSGGKGAALARMASAGLPVPTGFVVTAHAFGADRLTTPPALQQYSGAAGPLDAGLLEELSSQARQSIMERGVSAELSAEIRAAYQALGEGIAVSVRSSATAEDQAWASFAGQYDTFLNVRGHEALMDALLGVWSSLYSTRAVAYRMRLGIPYEAVSMAVVVQQLVEPDAAGVLFTRDPVTGDDSGYVVNVALGLGEGVASGEVPSDHFVVNRDTGAVLSQTIVKKDSMIAVAPSGGVTRLPVLASRQDPPALSAGQLADLAAAVRRLARLFDGHQDVEFAVQGGAVHLLQTRPITGEEPPPFEVEWQDPVDAQHTWTLGRGPLPRLQQEISLASSERQREVFAETGMPQARNHIVRFINSYPYARSPDVSELESKGRQARMLKIDTHYRSQGTSLYEAEIHPEVEEILAALKRFNPRRATLPETVYHLDHALAQSALVMGNRHWRMAAGGRFDWPQTYAKITGDAEVESGRLLQGLPNKTTQLIRRLRSLAKLVQQDEELGRIFRERSYGELQQASVLSRPTVQRFHAQFKGLLRAHGLRTGRGAGSFTGYRAATWNMDPTQSMDLIGAYAKQDLNALDLIEARAKRDRQSALRRIRRHFADDPEGLRHFEWELAIAMDSAAVMENHNHLMEQGVGGALREAIWWAGKRLVQGGVLAEPDDVMHLSLEELKAVAAGTYPGDVKATVAQRAAELEAHARLRPPATVGLGGPALRIEMREYEGPSHAGLDGLVLRGTAASPGKVTGRARVVFATELVPQVEQGDILVARNAGPTWTPIFPILSGIVLNDGAVFQHVAVVAREYGIPTVLMTREATEVIVDGQTITVDADEGFVDLAPRP